MSSAALTAPSTVYAVKRHDGLAARIWRALILCLLFSILFAPEFPRQSGSSFSSPIYVKLIGGFRYIDLIILALAFAHVVSFGCLHGTKLLGLPRQLAAPALAFVACIGMAGVYGFVRGGTNFFFDWRALVLGVALYIVWSFWLQGTQDLRFVANCFAVYMGVRVGLLLLLYVAGYGDSLLGVSIPVFDGPILSAAVFTALLAISSCGAKGKSLAQAGWVALALGSGVMVLVCMRRTYWAELGIGACLLFILRRRKSLRTVLLVGIMTGVAVVILGSSFTGRLASLDVSRSDTEFSADNADHVYDLVDAWEQVRQSPLLGIGLGTSYPTWHVRTWKPESVMVHNALLHVWLKYGLCGLLCYAWFHAVLLRWLYVQARTADPHTSAFLCAGWTYLTAQFIVTLGFAPWPYSELQLTTLTSFILAFAVAASSRPREACW